MITVAFGSFFLRGNRCWWASRGRVGPGNNGSAEHSQRLSETLHGPRNANGATWHIYRLSVGSYPGGDVCGRPERHALRPRCRGTRRAPTTLSRDEKSPSRLGVRRTPCRGEAHKRGPGGLRPTPGMHSEHTPCYNAAKFPRHLQSCFLCLIVFPVFIFSLTPPPNDVERSATTSNEIRDQTATKSPVKSGTGLKLAKPALCLAGGYWGGGLVAECVPGVRARVVCPKYVPGACAWRARPE